VAALVTEARAAGIGEAALSAALLAVGARMVSGRLTLNGHGNGHDDQQVPSEEPAPVQCPTIGRRCGRRGCGSERRSSTDRDLKPTSRGGLPRWVSHI
jgi:hypothetical protein